MTGIGVTWQRDVGGEIDGFVGGDQKSHILSAVDRKKNVIYIIKTTSW